MVKLFSKTVYDLNFNFKNCIRAESDTDIIHVLLPALEYHVRVAEADEIDVFAEFVLKLFSSGVTDFRKIAEILCLDPELVRHIIKTTLRDYIDSNRINDMGKSLLQNKYALRSDGKVYDFIFFVNACSGEIISVREENTKEFSQKITEDSLIIKIGKRSSQESLQVCPVSWTTQIQLEKETIQDYLSSHEMTVTFEENRTLKYPFAVCFSSEGIPVYLLTSLMRPRIVTDQYSWVARNPESGLVDLRTTETFKEIEKVDKVLADKISSVLLADVKKISIAESFRQAEPEIQQKIPFFNLLPVEIKEAVMEYQIQMRDAQMAKNNKLPYRSKLQSNVVNLRKILEDIIGKLNNKFQYVITRTVFDQLLQWDRNREISQKICDLFEEKLKQQIDVSEVKVSLKDFRNRMPLSYKLQSSFLCAVTVAAYRPQHPAAKLALESECFVQNVLDCIHALNAPAHDLKSNVSWDELNKFERQIFIEWSDLMKYAYDIKDQGE